MLTVWPARTPGRKGALTMGGDPVDVRTPRKRSKKNGTLVSAYIEKAAYDALQRHCEVTGQSKTKAIERAILSYCGGACGIGRSFDNEQ